MSLIDVRHLSLHLGGKTILDDVNMSMNPQELLMIIGPNGAGKSSLLKCLLALFDQYAGEIYIDGRQNRKLPPRARARLLGYVPQFLELQFNLDVLSFLELSRFAHDEESPRARSEIIEECLSRTETTHLKHAFLDQLSGGERQRVMIAAALAQQPRVLLLDEPSQSLDPAHRVELANLLGRLHREEKLAIVIVTHDWNELLHLEPQVMALKNGRVAFRTDTDALHDQLEDLFECGFHRLYVEGRPLSLPRNP